MGLVVVSSPDGHVHAFEADGCGAATCEPVWSAAVAGTPGSPIVNGRVIVTTSTGEVVTFGCRRRCSRGLRRAPQGP